MLFIFPWKHCNVVNWVVNCTCVQMDVSENSGTPHFTPQNDMIIFSRKTPMGLLGVLPTILGKSQIFTIYNHLKNCLPFASVVNRSDGLVLGRWRSPPWELGIHEVFSHFSNCKDWNCLVIQFVTFLGWWKRDPQKSLSDLQLDQLGDQKVTAWIT